MKAKLVKRLADKIYKAKVAYYTTNTPIMSDAEYDALERSLQMLAPNHPVLQMVGYDITGTFKKLSLSETEAMLNGVDNDSKTRS